MNDLAKRLELASPGGQARHLLVDNYTASADNPTPDEYELGVIVGMIRVRGCYASGSLPWPTVWHNPPDIAWMIDDALKFENPIELPTDDKFQTRVGLVNRPQYKGAIEREYWTCMHARD